MALTSVANGDLRDRRLSSAEVVWGLFLILVLGIGFPVISNLVATLRESTSDLVLSDQRSRVNPEFLQLQPIPYGNRSSMPEENRDMGAGGETWLLDAEYPDGSIPAGTYDLMFNQRPSPCWSKAGQCSVAISYGYCRGRCSALLPPIVTFQHPLDRSLAGLKNFQDVQGPAVLLSGCPCHFYLQMQSTTPPGTAWVLAYGPGPYTQFDPASSQSAKGPIFVTIAWACVAAVALSLFLNAVRHRIIRR